MSNIYLEKAASLYDFWDNVSGRKYHELKNRKYHLEVALANKETPRSLGARAHVAGKRMFRARAQAAGAAIGAVGAVAAGVKGYEGYQQERTRKNLQELMSKQAGLSSMFSPVFKEGAKSGSRSFGTALKHTVSDSAKGLVDSLNTAHGGKVKSLGESVFGHKSEVAKEYASGSHAKRRELLSTHAPGKLKELDSLRRKQRVAQVGVYGTGAVLTGTYLKGKETGRNEVLQAQYY